MSREDLKPLTSLRFAAALMVFAWHALPFLPAFYGTNTGCAGVGFFFLLSGFILTYTYHADFRDGVRVLALRRFYVARFARIYPLHVVTIAIAVCGLVVAGSDVDVWDVSASQRVMQVVLQAALVQAWVPIKSIFLGANGPSWSISAEAFFYALFPAFAFLGSTHLANLTYRRILLIATALWIALIVTLLPQHASRDDWRFYILPAARVPDFVVGMILGFAFLRRQKLRLWLRPTSVEMLAVVVIPLMMLVGAILPNSLHFSAWMMPAFSFAILVFADGRGAISRLLSHKIAVRLGEMSFAFYLVHESMLRVAGHFLGYSSPIGISASLLISLALSYVLFHLVETPMRRVIRDAFDPNRRAVYALLTHDSVEAVEVVAAK